MTETYLYPKPEEPGEEDCCNSGCELCVFDIYRKRLEEWESRSLRVQLDYFRSDLLSQTKCKPFKVIKIVKHSETIYHLRFIPVSDITSELDGILPYRPGQHLVIHCPSEKDSNRLISRPYSVISDVKSDKCEFEIVIKVYKNGFMTQFLKSLGIGDVTFWRGPYGNFEHSVNKFSNMLMLAMGTGVAPLYTIVRQIVSNEEDMTNIKLLYGIRFETDIVLRDELCSLAHYWNFNFIYHITGEEPPAFSRFGEVFLKGRITENCLRGEFLKKERKSSLFVLISGSEEFACTIKTISLNYVNEEQIYTF